MTINSLLTVKVWGDFALFTRPEFSAERVSYQVMTPSAARGMLEAIFWKPEMAWQVHEIHVLNPIRHFSILRNEVNSHQSDRAVATWQKTGVGGYYADTDRAQRHSLCLRDVAYLIKASIKLKPHETNIIKYRDQFRRRVTKGQCHHQPYFGTREFSAFFGDPDGTEDEQRLKFFPYPEPIDFGLMLFDMEIAEATNGSMTYLNHNADGVKVIKGNAKPKFFHAQLQQGVLTVSADLYRRSQPS